MEKSIELIRNGTKRPKPAPCPYDELIKRHLSEISRYLQKLEQGGSTVWCQRVAEEMFDSLKMWREDAGMPAWTKEKFAEMLYLTSLTVSTHEQENGVIDYEFELFFLDKEDSFAGHILIFVSFLFHIFVSLYDKFMKDQMEEEFDYKSVPFRFAHCFNNKCPKAKSCLRNIVARHTTAEHPFVDIVNPVCIPADGNACPHFLSADKIRIARGITHLLDNVPYKNARELKRLIIAHFGKAKYYRFHRKECYLTPEDQEFIRQLFQEKGIQEELVFDEYNQAYRW